jgi:site-specific DNA-methyltransferase (adenine-specific)
MSVRIVHGDCRAILPGIEADALITDPVWPNCPAGLLAGWEDPQKLLAAALAVAPASIKRVVIVLRSDSDPRFLAAVPERWPFVCVQALPYAVPMYLGRVLGGTELAYCFGAPIPSREGRRVIPMWGPKAQPRDRPANGHPCSRAMVHMEWLVQWWTEPGETVVDPFAGSGTIPLAAERCQRHGIGIEIDERYCGLANERIANDAPLLADAALAEGERKT